MNYTDWNRVAAVTLQTVNRYSVLLAVFDSVNRTPELATGIALALREGAYLITAAHVVNRFCDLGRDGRLQIGLDGYVLKDIPRESICIGRKVDIASIKLTPKQLSELGLTVLPWTDVARWSVQEGTLVAFRGYPGDWKRWHSDDSIGIGSYEYLGYVETTEDDQFSVRVNPQHEMTVETNQHARSFTGFEDIGGLSGSPIFQAADHPKLVGIVSEGKAFSLNEQKIYAVHVNVVNQDGRITA